MKKIDLLLRKALLSLGVLLVATACGGGGGGSGNSTLPPPTQSFALTLTLSGNGQVASQPTGLSCNAATCNASFPADTLVTLAANPQSGHSFAGWSGACTGESSTCVVGMSQARTVGASFAPIFGTNFTLTVAVAGSGTVVSNPTGINCGSTCSANYASGTSVTLTANPGAGQVFSSWSGACSGNQPTCVLNMTQVRSAQALIVPAANISWSTPQLLENSDDFNVADTNQFTDVGSLVAIAPNGDAIAMWQQQSDAGPMKVFSRRYMAATGWQAPQTVPGVTSSSFLPLMVAGQLFLDNAGTATWLRPNMETRRNTQAGGWGAAFLPAALPSGRQLQSAVMDGSGNIGVVAISAAAGFEYGSVFNAALPVGTNTWLDWARVNVGSAQAAHAARVAISTNGTALAIWSERNPGDSNYSMRSSRYTAAGGWGTPEAIEALFTNLDSAPGQVVMDAAGNGIAMWRQGGGLYYNLYRSGSGWQGAVRVGAESFLLSDTGNIQLVMAPDGRAVATWTSGSSTLRSMQYHPSTGWGAPETIESGHARRRLQMDASGLATMVYAIVNPTTSNFELVSRRLVHGGQWSAASPMESAPGDVRGIRFELNTAGKGVAIWMQNDLVNSGIRNSLWSALLP